MMMSYNSRPPATGGGGGGGGSTGTTSRRGLPSTTVQPIQNAQRIRIDNDETESFYTPARGSSSGGGGDSHATSNKPTHHHHHHSTLNSPGGEASGGGRSSKRYSTSSQLENDFATPLHHQQQQQNQHNQQRRESDQVKAFTILSSNDYSLSPVKRRWLRAFEAMRSNLPSVSTRFLFHFHFTNNLIHSNPIRINIKQSIYIICIIYSNQTNL